MHHALCPIAQGSCCPWIEGGCECQCRCDIIEEVVQHTRQEIFEKLIVKANRAASGKIERPSEVDLIANMIGDETADYIKWIALMIRDGL